MTELDPKINVLRQANTLESLIEGLDQRGLLVLQVLLGQQAMKLLSDKHTKEVTKPSVIKPNA